MLHFPEVMKAAQADLYRVVGYDRMPEFEDKENLPYIVAIINETLRCATSFALKRIVDVSSSGGGPLPC